MSGSTGITEALTALLKSRTEWDEAPGLHFLYRHAGAVRVSPDSIVPDSIWPEVPTYALPGMAETLEECAGLLSAVAPPGLIGPVFRCEMWLIGAVFRCEMWRVQAPQSDPVAACQALDMQHARRLHEHPDRVEQRCAWAVTRDGGHYVAEQARGERRIDVRKAYGTVKGLIPESLERIVRAISAGVN